MVFQKVTAGCQKRGIHAGTKEHVTFGKDRAVTAFVGHVRMVRGNGATMNVFAGDGTAEFGSCHIHVRYIAANTTNSIKFHGKRSSDPMQTRA